MLCKNCGHEKNEHDSDVDFHVSTEWCNVENCKCPCFEEVEAVEHLLAPDVFTGCANCVEFEDCPFRDGYCSAWAPRG